MKKWMAIGSLIIIVACQQKPDSLIGKWAVLSKFYKATYLISEESQGFNALVLSYDDGTTRYKHDGTKKHYVFTGLKKKKHQYVDGISGASTKADSPPNLSIQKKHKDTLEVTTYQMNKPLLEIWVRR